MKQTLSGIRVLIFHSIGFFFFYFLLLSLDASHEFTKLNVNVNFAGWPICNLELVRRMKFSSYLIITNMFMPFSFWSWNMVTGIVSTYHHVSTIILNNYETGDIKMVTAIHIQQFFFIYYMPHQNIQNIYHTYHRYCI